MKMKQYLMLFLLLGFVVSGCASSKPVSSKSGINIGGAVEVEIWASMDCIMPGEKVDLRATVTNRTGGTQVFELKGKPVLDIIVGFNESLPNGELRWSDGKPLTSDLTRLELEPGQLKTIEMSWAPERGVQGTVGVNALFNYNEHAGVTPAVLVNVAFCPGPLGP